ncbi:MAG: GntR family transcriptional regulator [Geminicoccaceae bacterium]
MLQLERPRSLTALVLDRLRQGIVCGDVGLGEQLSESALARQLGVSKTPVREALQQLRNEGLVRIVPHTGTFVFTMSAREVKELCELRLTLERAALGFAVERNREPLLAALRAIAASMDDAHGGGDIRRYLELDTAYHAEFFARCGNPYMAQAYDNIAGRIAALRTHLAARPSHTQLSLAEHRVMIDAIARGDPDAFFALLDQHIERTRQSYSAHIEDIAQADRAYDRNRPARHRLQVLETA